MRCIRNLSQAYLKSSKARSRLIVLAVSLSTILLIAIYSMFIHGRLVDKKMRYTHQYGEFDGYYLETSEGQREKVIADSCVLDYGTLHQLPYVQLQDKTAMKMQYADENLLKSFDYKLSEGRYPLEDNEVALTRHALSRFNPSAKIGDEIVIDVLRHTEGKEENNPPTFRITGIFEDRLLDQQKSIAFIAENYARQAEHSEYHFFVKVEGSEKEEMVDAIAEEAGILGSRARSKTKTEISPEFALIMALVMVLSIIAISSIFSYAIIERVNNLGLLKAIGMTNKQIRKLLQKEGLYYLIRGLIIGIIVGSIIHVILLIMSYGNTTYLQPTTFSLWTYIGLSIQIAVQQHYYIVALGIIIFLEAFGVWVSIKIPSRKIKKISIIESIDYSGTIKWKRLKKLTKKVKSPVIRITLTNMLSNPIKQLLTILTISISAILFLYFSYFTSMSSSEKMIRRGISGDIQIMGLPQSKLTFINELEGVEKKAIEVTVLGKIPTNQLIIGDTYTDDLKRLNTYKTNNEDAHIKIRGFNDLVLTRYYNKYGESDYTLDELKKMKNWCFVLDRDHGVRYKIGDKLTVDGIELIIVGKFERISSMWNEWIAPIIVVPEQHIYNHYNELSDIRVSLDIDKENYQTVKTAIKDNIVNATYINYIDELRAKRKKQIQQRSLMVYIFIGMIALISFLMIFNSTYTSIVTRRREIGMLRAIGMTSMQFRKSLHLEGNVVIILTTVIGLPIGYAIPYYGHLNFISYPGNEGIPFIFPIWSLSIFVAFYVLMRGIITFCIRRLEREAVTELIRNN